MFRTPFNNATFTWRPALYNNIVNREEISYINGDTSDVSSQEHDALFLYKCSGQHQLLPDD